MNHQDTKTPSFTSTYQSADSILDERYVEIYEQAETLARELQVRQKLCFVDRQKAFDCFDLDNHKVIDHNIHAKPSINTQIAILDGQRNLSGDQQTSRLELMNEALLINAFKESGTKGRVNCESRIDNRAGRNVVLWGQLVHLGAFVSLWFSSFFAA